MGPDMMLFDEAPPEAALGNPAVRTHRFLEQVSDR